MNAATTEITGNYSISNGITISSVSLSSNGMTATLTTSAHSAGTNYTVTVSNATDLAGNVINPQANFASYLMQGETIAPEVTGAELADSITVYVHFSEAVSQTTAGNTANYSIDNGIDIISAVLSSNGNGCHAYN